MDLKGVSLLSAIFGLVGGVILAFSLNRTLSEVRFAVNALATSIESVMSNGDVYIFRGLDERLKTANRISGLWVRIGIYCLVVSAILASWNIYAANITVK